MRGPLPTLFSCRQLSQRITTTWTRWFHRKVSHLPCPWVETQGATRFIWPGRRALKCLVRQVKTRGSQVKSCQNIRRSRLVRKWKWLQRLVGSPIIITRHSLKWLQIRLIDSYSTRNLARDHQTSYKCTGRRWNLIYAHNKPTRDPSKDTAVEQSTWPIAPCKPTRTWTVKPSLRRRPKPPQLTSTLPSIIKISPKCHSRPNTSLL